MAVQFSGMRSAAARFSWTALVLACGLWAVSLQAGAVRRARIAGREYVGLANWAQAGGLEVRWLKRDQTLQLSSRSAKVTLTLDSREAEVNGVEIWLSFPPVERNGTVFLAQLDAETALKPLLSPPKNRAREKIRLVCLDPGHGGKDPGNCVGSNQEKRYTLLLAQEIRQLLARAGIKAVLTRTKDSFVELPDRPDFARRSGADLFISLHFNSAGTERGSVKGAQVFCLTPAGARSTNSQGENTGAESCAGNRCNDKNLFLACQVQKALTQQLGAQDLGVRRARFAVLREAVMPAILIEGGFMSHPVEGKKIFSAVYRKQMAQAIVDGLLAYKKQVERAG